MEEKIFAVKREEPGSRVGGRSRVKVAVLGVSLSKSCEPREPHLES